MPAALRKCLRENFMSEQILQRKLENPGIERLADHPERGITENDRGGIARKLFVTL